MSERFTAADFDHSPFVAFYEVTRACDLACRHCRPCAQSQRHPGELTLPQAADLMAQFAEFSKPPLVVFTGGDPLKRPAIYDIAEAASESGLTTAIAPAATSLLTKTAIRKLKHAGISRIAIGIDGADAATHDGMRGVPGSFDRSVKALRDARALGLPTQVDTLLTHRNCDQVDRMAEEFAALEIGVWSVSFLVPVGRGLAEERITGEECERVFERLWQQSRIRPYCIKTDEAPHYRRYVLGKAAEPVTDPPRFGRVSRVPLGLNSGKGVMFVSHTGGVYPGAFLPILCGRFPKEAVVDIYRNSPVFRSLRTPALLKGKCSLCEFKQLCGGSRARAYAVTRDLFAQEPDCVYQPRRFQEAACSA
jgi:radical SAM protein